MPFAPVCPFGGGVAYIAARSKYGLSPLEYEVFVVLEQLALEGGAGDAYFGIIAEWASRVLRESFGGAGLARRLGPLSACAARCLVRMAGAVTPAGVHQYCQTRTQMGAGLIHNIRIGVVDRAGDWAAGYPRRCQGVIAVPTWRRAGPLIL